MGMNEKLGLPRDKMRRYTIAFDVDGTLRDNTKEEPVANESIRTLLIILSTFKNIKIVVWSGSGELYARQIATAFGLQHYVDQYASKTDWQLIAPDLAIDDIQDTAIGQLNFIVREK